MMGEPFDVLAEPVGIKLFYGIHDLRMDVAAAFVKHPVIGDVVGESVLEGVSQVGEDLCCVKKLSGLKIVEKAVKRFLRMPANSMQQSEWDVLSDDRRLFQQAFLDDGQGVDTGSQHRAHSGRDLNAREWPRQAVAAAGAFEHAGIEQARTISSTKNGFPLARSTRKLFRSSDWVGTQ